VPEKAGPRGPAKGGDEATAVAMGSHIATSGNAASVETHVQAMNRVPLRRKEPSKRPLVRNRRRGRTLSDASAGNRAKGKATPRRARHAKISDRNPAKRRRRKRPSGSSQRAPNLLMCWKTPT
jgi:hypothetical protein